jgi:ubiquinone/menaquinone biosynthesis C-methylase UbiE
LPSSRLIRFLYNRLAFAYEPVLSLGARLGISHEVHIRQQILAHLDFPTGARLLDLGCGTAAARSFLPESIRYVGLDLALNMLRQADKSNPALTPRICADLEAPPLLPHQFDVILCMGVLQHLSTPQTALRRMARLLRPPGRILILDEQQPLARAFGIAGSLLADFCADLLGLPVQRTEPIYEYLLIDLAGQD